MAQEPEISDKPIAGDITNTEWVSMKELIVTVESDGETWKESYTFEQAEKVVEE